MARLEITSPSGKVRSTPLPEGAALSVGRHDSCDVRINADGVEPVHCRFLPDGEGYRVSAGSEDGLRVNGAAVAEKRLSEGDTIDVGPAKLTYRAEVPAEAEAKPKPAAVFEEVNDDEAEEEANGGVSGAAAAAIFADEEDGEEPEEEGTGFGALAALAADETGEVPEPTADAGTDEPPAADPSPTASPSDDGPDSGEQPVLLPPGGKFAPLTKLAGPPRRPGEQSIFKSPLVVGLASVAAVLTLAAFAIAFLTAREQAERLYEAAAEARAGGQYTAALEQFDRFLVEYPGDALSATVRRERGLTTIEQEIDGSAGDWAAGLTAMNEFVRENRDLEDFGEVHAPLAALARRAALGAAREASAGGPRDLLGVIEEAGTLHRRYADPELAATPDRTREIADALTGATAAVVKRETFGEARKKVTAALERNDFAAAHRARENLIARYAELAKDRDVRKLERDTLDAEADAVTEIPAADAPPPPTPRPAALAPAFVARSGTGEGSDGRSILTGAGPSLFAVDAVTAEPLWRASVGAGGLAPFAAVRADSANSAVLVCDAVRPALLSIDRTSGAVNWRLPLPAPATGPPRSAGGRALIGCADGSLLAVNPADGSVDGGLKFPQRVLSPPVAIGGGGEAAGRLLLVAGQNTMYTLKSSPLALEAVSYTAHGLGAVAVPPQSVPVPSVPIPPQPVGRYVLICDNDRADSGLLRAFTVDEDSGEASEVGRARVNGRIDVPPELRADGLFVSSSPERLTAYAVTDEPGKQVFNYLGAAQIPDPRAVPTFLAAGPDGALWAAGTALRKLELTGDELRLTPAVLAVGRHVAPPKTSGDRLFTTRLTPAGTATIFAAAEADAMVGLGRTVLAPKLLAVTGGDRPSVLSATGVLTPLGDGFAEEPDGTSGETTFLTNGRDLPGLDGNGTDPLLARSLPEGGAVAAVGGPEPRAWEIDAAGRGGRPIDLPAAPQIAPLPLGPGLLVATAGRLELVVGRGGGGVSPFTAPVSGGDPPAWTAAVRLTETRAAVTDAAGSLRLVEYRDKPAPNLAETAVLAPGWYADVPPAAAGDALLVAGSDGNLHRLSAATLGETAAVPLPARAAFGPTVVGERVLVALQDGSVAGYAAADLTGETITALPAPAVGPPAAIGEAAAVTTTAGSVLRFDPTTGAATGLAELGQPLAGEVFLVRDVPAAAAADGAIVRLRFDPPGDPPGGAAVAAGGDQQ